MNQYLNEENYITSYSTLSEYAAYRQLPDGRWIGIHRLLFHWTLHVDIHDFGYEDRWCIDTLEHALEAMMAWNGEGEPLHWHKHPSEGMNRDPITNIRWSDKSKVPKEVELARAAQRR